MKVRLKQPVVEARQWDGDLDRMKEWVAANLNKSYQCGHHRDNPGRLSVTFSRFSFSLAEGDWLVVSGDDSAQKVLKAEFDAKFERVGLTEPVSGWTPMVQAQHELAVMIPGMLLEIGKENWGYFCKWLVAFAQNTAEDPKKHAYSIG